MDISEFINIYPLRKNLNALKKKKEMFFLLHLQILPLCLKQMGTWVCSLNVAQKVLFRNQCREW